MSTNTFTLPTDRPHILYFFSGEEMTEVDRKEVQKIADLGSSFISFRKASQAALSETCDGVAGAVPEGFNNTTSAAEAIEAFKDPEPVVPVATPSEPKVHPVTAFKAPVVDEEKE